MRHQVFEGSQWGRPIFATLAMVLIAGTSSEGWSQVEVAEELLVELSAADPSAGSPIWANTAPASIGDFLKVGDPFVEIILGLPAVTFNAGAGLDAYQSELDAPPGIVGPDPTRSIEAWVFNSTVDDEETIVAWGARQVPAGSNMSFNYGTNPNWGAVGHWDAPDLGWGPGGAPAAGVWHHLVYTYDGTTTRVYADGCLVDETDCPTNSEVVGSGVINTFSPSKVTLAAQLMAGGVTISSWLRGILSIAGVRIHDGVLTPAQVAHNFALGCCEPLRQFLRGDGNQDGIVDLGDAVYVLEHLLRGGPAPTCEEAADADGNGSLNITDAVFGLNYAYLGGPLPPGQFPDCETGPQSCVYAENLCGEEPPERTDSGISLEIVTDGPSWIEDGGSLVGHVDLRNPELHAVNGWSIQMLIDDPQLDRCRFADASFEGTLGAAVTDPEPGLRDGGFAHVDLPPYEDPVFGTLTDTRITSAVVLGLVDAIHLPLTPGPHRILRFEVAGLPSGEVGCKPCSIRLGGFRLSEAPESPLLRTRVTTPLETFDPQLGSETIDICHIPELLPPAYALDLELEAGAPVYFKLGTQPGDVVTLELEGSPDEDTKLYARWGDLPTESAFDFASVDPAPDRRLVIPFARGGTYYLRVQSPFQLGVNPVSVSATIGPLAIERVTAGCPEGCSGSVSFAALGGGFDEDVSFALEAGGDRVLAEEALIVSSERAELRFVLTIVPPGLYDLVAEQGVNSARLPGAIRVVSSQAGAKLATELSLPRFYRADVPRRATLRSRNSGDAEMAAPLYVIRGTPGVSLWLANGAEPSGSLQVLGLDAGGIAGLLAAGATGELPVLFEQEGGAPSLELTASVLSASPGDLVGWSEIAPPAGVSAESWALARPRLEQSLGATWPEVQSALGGIATRLSHRGDLTASVLDLFRFAYTDAAGHPTSAIIGVARDDLGNPDPGLLLGARALGGGPVLACAAADSEGAFALAPLPPGEYEIVVDGREAFSEPVDVPDGEDALAVEVVLGAAVGSDLQCPALELELALPEEPLPIPEHLLQEWARAGADRVQAIDPNEKEGPGEGIRVRRGAEIQYTIYFENKASSTGAARYVEIIDDLAPDFDLSSFRFLDLHVGGTLEPLDTAGGRSLTSGYAIATNGDRLALENFGTHVVSFPEPSIAWNVKLATTASLDPAARRVTWVIEATDLPDDADPRAGFLPPNDSTHRGEGFVTFRVQLLPGTSVGKQVENKASIRFDTEEPIITRSTVLFVADDPVRYVRGDVNDDSRIDISDAVSLLNYLFQGGAAPPCTDAGDANDSGGESPDISDAVHILSWLFQGAPSSSLTGTCGEDPPSASDTMTCESFSGCP